MEHARCLYTISRGGPGNTYVCRSKAEDHGLGFKFCKKHWKLVEDILKAQAKQRRDSHTPRMVSKIRYGDD